VIKPRWQDCRHKKRSKPFRRDWLKLLLFGFALMINAATAAPILDTGDPVGFFTNVASRLLATELNVNLAQIEIYPTNQYTPAVHRLLQVSANIYDATTTNFYPTVFRPLFSRDANGTGTNIYITGYTNIVPFTDGANDIQLSQPFDVQTISTFSGTILNVPDNIYGVPWIIGAKKGFPNFNEFSMENNLAVTRRLQITRPTTNSATSVNFAAFGTNQMYLMSLTSSLGVELWNSYSASYPGAILIGVNENASLTITNDDHGQNLLFSKTFSTNALFSINSWPGAAPWYAGNPNSLSFVVAVFAGPTLTNSVYRSSYASAASLGNLPISPPGFVPTNNFAGSVSFEQNSPNGFYLPQFGVLLTNRLQVFMLDFSNGVYHVIDYVHFAGPDSSFNVNSNLVDNDATNNYVGVWDTNYPADNLPPTGPTFGILNQILISKNGSPPVEDGLWSSDPGAFPLGTIAQQQAYFQAFFLPGNRFGTTTNLQLIVQAPYSPTRYIVQYLTWQANDPLVHYLASDIDAPSLNTSTVPQPGVNHYNAGQVLSGLTSLNLNFLNDRFMPWGGQPRFLTADQNPTNSAIEDPLVLLSDNWNFPVKQPLNPNWIGQVHRGTPWQTIYLKSTDFLATNNGLATWMTWTGDSNPADATAMAPVQDWRLASLLASLFNTNNFAPLFRVNNPDTNAWQGLLNGLTASTNIPDQFDSVLISSNSSQAMVIANAIQSERAVQPGQIFSDVGDILATPQLAEQSPFLTGQNYSIGDAAYELIPSQLLSLLRADSIGSIYLTNNQPLVQFTGYDGHSYAVQASSDFVNWSNISTNFPLNEIFTLTNSIPLNAKQRFYRSVLLQ
jgi:hypothetical protein